MPTSSPDPTTDGTPALMAAMRAWRAAHPQATFAEIEIEATRQVAGVRRDLIAAVLEGSDPGEVPACPACGRAMVRNGTRHRTILTSHQARVVVQGPRYRCSACGAELFPPR